MAVIIFYSWSDKSEAYGPQLHVQFSLMTFSEFLSYIGRKFKKQKQNSIKQSEVLELFQHLGDKDWNCKPSKSLSLNEQNHLSIEIL